jgi:hypothetical protein
MFDGYRKMIDQSFSTSKDLADMLRFLPGVVVQKPLGMQGMADLYRIKPDFLEGFIKSTIEPLCSDVLYPGFYPRPSRHPHYTLMAICLVSCRTETVLSSITAIQNFNIFLFGVFTASIQCF